MHLSGLAHAATSYRGLVLTAFQNPAEFLWVYPAGAAVLRCRSYCVQPSVSIRNQAKRCQSRFKLVDASLQV
jgi:hypothetical protein